MRLPSARARNASSGVIGRDIAGLAFKVRAEIDDRVAGVLCDA